MYLVTASEMQEMDRQTIESFGMPGRVLMENAGRGATRILLDHFCGCIKRNVGVIAGRGNNGGDGFVIARYLAQKGITVSVYLLAESNTVKGDAAANLKLLSALEIPLIEIPDKMAFSKHKSKMRHFDLWVDAIFGTGLKSEVKGYFRDVINFINSLNKPILAVDIPSGLNSDTGQPCGACIRAQATATFAFAKTGHLLYPGATYTGRLQIVDIGIPNHIAEKVGPKQYLLTPNQVQTYFHPRPPDVHKGRTGHLLIVAGSPGKTGAAAMTAISAMRTGAGLVTLAIPKSLNPVLESQVLEAMTEPLPELQDGALGESAFDPIMNLISQKKCLALGPGLGQAEDTRHLVCRIIKESPIPMVVDADGLNNLAGNTAILKKLKVPIILTPHPGEMARLMDTTVGNVQSDRINCSRDFAVNFNAHVVLKGARTVVANPAGNAYINPTGNSGMASGGMGDVLTGIIASLITQGFTAEAAAHAGVYLHGAAADTLAESIGPFGFLASDVMNAIPGEIKKLTGATTSPSDNLINRQ
ncbi:MAG: NAD(P)H-hydrate dehydratase [Desulfobacterales bacterium]|nr:MAG: NAD(P)H-hydrate dehydratase [Desulfobacterales bacterium]